MRKFRIECVGIAEIEIDDSVIEAVDDEFRASLYNLRTPEEIAKHVGYNVVVNQIALDQMDGWADQSHTNLRVSAPTLWDVIAREIK